MASSASPPFSIPVNTTIGDSGAASLIASTASRREVPGNSRSSRMQPYGPVPVLERGHGIAERGCPLGSEVAAEHVLDQLGVAVVVLDYEIGTGSFPGLMSPP